MVIPRVRHYLLKVFMMDPERAKVEGDRARVLIKGQLEEDGFVIGNAMRKDFGSS